MENNKRSFGFRSALGGSGFLLGSLIILCVVNVFSQTAPTKYWVQFKDRVGTPYSISNPSVFLSQRAIDRRAKQNITIKENDLPINPSYINGVLALDTIQLLNKSKWFNAITIRITDTAVLQAISGLAYVNSVLPVALFKRDKEEINNSALKTFAAASSGKYSYGDSYNQISMIGVDCIHDKGFDGEGLLIAVQDAGFFMVDVNPAFDSLRTRNAIIGTRDFVTGNDSVYEDDSHGSYVLSTMGAHLPGKIVGTAPRAKYLLLRSEDAASEYMIEEDNWVAAAEYADSIGADVINSSLGYTQFDDPSQNHTYADMDGNTARITIGADIAASKGVLVVNSAGNSGNGPWNYIGAPADGDSVLAVGAVSANAIYVSFSSEGPSYDGRVKPNVAAKGQGATVANFSGGVAFASGTSFSSPIMAGAAASLWQAHPTATNMQIYHAIEQSGSQWNNPDNYIGYGVPNMCVAHEILLGKSPEEFTQSNVIDFYPNPFESEINFKFFSGVEQTLIVRLYNALGQMVVEEPYLCGENKLYYLSLPNLQTVAEGAYIFEIYSDAYQKRIKMVKTKY